MVTDLDDVRQRNFEVLEVIGVGWFTSIFVFLIVATAADIVDGVCRNEQQK